MREEREHFHQTTLKYAIAAGRTTPHSIILGHSNALIFQCKFFLRMRENRLHDPSKICALEFKRISPIWNLVGFSDYRHQFIDFSRIAPTDRKPAPAKKTVTRLSNSRARDQTCVRRQCHLRLQRRAFFDLLVTRRDQPPARVARVRPSRSGSGRTR